LASSLLLLLSRSETPLSAGLTGTITVFDCVDDELCIVDVLPFGTTVLRNVLDSVLGESIESSACTASSLLPAVSHTSGRFGLERLRLLLLV